MSLSPESRVDDQLLVRYLLGLLPDDAAERLDEMSIADDEIAARLRVVEDQLVDDYASGALPPETRERFEAYYLSSPHRREKVRFAASFLAAVERAHVPADPEAGIDGRASCGAELATRASTTASPHRGVRLPRAIWMLSAAAVLLISVSGVLLVQQLRLRQRLDAAQASSDDLERRSHQLEQQLADQRAASAETARELERVRASMAALAPPPGAAVRARRGGAPAVFHTLALLLLPQTRSIGPIAALTIPQGVQRVTFELRLESSPLPRYQVALKDPATNRTVWRSGRVAASPGDPASVRVSVPASLLRPQHYSLELKSQSPDGGSQIVASYAVRIVGR